MIAFGPWAGAYIGILALWSLALAMRRRPTLWKGRSLLILNVGFALAVLVTAIACGERPDNALAAFLVSIVVAGIIGTRLWLLFHIDRAVAEQIVEKCLGQTLAKYEMDGDRYTVHTAGEDMTIEIGNVPPALRIRLSGGRGSKKAALIRSLFGKQFCGSVPTLRVRT